MRVISFYFYDHSFISTLLIAKKHLILHYNRYFFTESRLSMVLEWFMKSAIELNVNKKRRVLIKNFLLFSFANCPDWVLTHFCTNFLWQERFLLLFSSRNVTSLLKTLQRNPLETQAQECTRKGLRQHLTHSCLLKQNTKKCLQKCYKSLF